MKWLLLVLLVLPVPVLAQTSTSTPRPTTTPAMNLQLGATATPTQPPNAACPSGDFSLLGLDPGWTVACGHCLQRPTSSFATYVPTYGTPTRIPTMTQSGATPTSAAPPTLLPTATRTPTLVPPTMITIQDNDPRVSGPFAWRGTYMTNYSGPISVSLDAPMCITDVTLRVRRDLATDANTPNFIVLRIGSQVATWGYLAAQPGYRDAPFPIAPVRVSSFEVDAETFGGTRVIQLDYIKLLRDESACVAPATLTPTPTLTPTATVPWQLSTGSYDCSVPLYSYGGSPPPPVLQLAVDETLYQCYILFPGFLIDQPDLLGNSDWDLYIDIPGVEICIHWVSINFGILGITLPIVELLTATAVITFVTRYLWKAFQ